MSVDYCCGKTPPNGKLCYDMHEFLDLIWDESIFHVSQFRNLRLPGGASGTYPSSDVFLPKNYILIPNGDDIPIGMNMLVTIMNDYAQSAGFDPQFSFDPNTKNICAANPTPGFGKLCICKDNGDCYVPAIPNGGVSSNSQYSQPFCIQPDTIHCGNFEPESVDAIFDPSAAVDDLYIFPGHEEAEGPFRTSDIINSTASHPNAPSPRDAAILVNAMVNSGALNAGIGCINLNCIDLSTFVDGLWEDEQLVSEIDAILIGEGLDPATVKQDISNSLKNELSSISLAKLLNEKLGLNIPDIPCDGDPIEWGDAEFPFAGPENTESGFLGPQKSADQFDTDYDFFAGDIAGLGQSGPNTPAASALDQIKSISGGVNLYNGSQSSSIPLYTLQARDISMPIGLSSQNNGLKVDDMGGLMGQNWSLNAGGVVTRVANGLPDEYCGTATGTGTGFRPYIIPRLELFSNIGIRVEFGGILKSLNNLGCTDASLLKKVKLGFTIAEKNIGGKSKITVKWHVTRPEVINLTTDIFIGTVPIIPLPPISIDLYAVVGHNSGIGINQRLVDDVQYEEDGKGFLLSDDNSCPGGFNSPIDYDSNDPDFLVAAGPPNAGHLQDIHPGRKRDDAVFLNDIVSNYNTWKDALNNAINNPQPIETRKLDTEPDEFYFNIGKYSGYFSFTHDGEVVLVPQYNSLEVETTKENGHIIRIEITTPEGLKYTVWQGRWEARIPCC